MRSIHNRAFQTDRVFWVSDKVGPKTGWYFDAREGVFGPFPSQVKASYDLTLLIEGNPTRRENKAYIQNSWGVWRKPMRASAI